MTTMMTTTTTMTTMTMMMTNCDSVQFDLWGPRALALRQVPPLEDPFEHQQAPLLLLPPAPPALPSPLPGAPRLIPSGAEPPGLPLRRAAPAGTQHRCQSCLLSKGCRNLQGICPECPRAGEKCLPACCQRDAGSQFVFSVFISPALNIQRPNLTSRHRENPNCKI